MTTQGQQPQVPPQTATIPNGHPVPQYVPAAPPPGYVMQTTPVQAPPKPMSSAGLWAIFGGITAGVLVLAIIAILLAPDCGKPPPPRPDGHTMTVRMKVRNPHEAALERIAKLERDKKAMGKKIGDLEKEKVDALKADNADLKKKVKELQKLLNDLQKAVSDEERDRLNKKIKKLQGEIADLKEKLEKKPKVVVQTKTRVVRVSPKGESKEDRVLRELRDLKKGQKAHLGAFEDLRRRVNAAHPPGQTGTPTGPAPAPPPNSGGTP